jgi:hypothetical protein
MLKIREVFSFSEDFPLNSEVYVDEFVLGGKEDNKAGRSYNSKKKKAITAVQLTKDSKEKGMSAVRIEDFSAQSLQYVFIKHISKQVKVVTDKWRGYIPI